MDIHVWCILASVLLASTQAIRYDLNPQKFYEKNPSPVLRSQKFGTKEVILYLTPSQVKALEAGGAVVRTQPAEPETTTEAQKEEPVAEEPQQEAEPEQLDEKIENENSEEVRPVSDLEEIFRILNEQIEEQQQKAEEDNKEQANEEAQPNEEEESANEEDSESESDEDSGSESESESDEEEESDNESNSEEEDEEEEEKEVEEQKKEVTEKPREVPARFRFVAKSQKAKKQEKYVAPIVAKKEREQANYAYIRFLPNDQTEEIRLQLVNTNVKEAPAEPEPKQEEQAAPSTEAPEQQQTSQLVPYEVTEEPEEAAPAEDIEIEEIESRLAALLTPLINHEKIAESINEQKKKLLQNELEIQNLLRELTQAPKHNDQKYAIEIQRLRANLERQNALSKAEALAKTATTPTPVANEEASKKKRRLVQSAKSSKAKTAPLTTLARLTQLAEAKKAQTETVKPTVQKTDKKKAEKSAQLQIQKRVPVTTTKYVKVPKQYPVQRVIPVEVKREVPVTLPARKSTVLRPIWEH